MLASGFAEEERLRALPVVDRIKRFEVLVFEHVSIRPLEISGADAGRD
jgi:hypothetical protein